jgi:hypothetical protein
MGSLRLLAESLGSSDKFACPYSEDFANSGYFVETEVDLAGFGGGDLGAR